MQAEEDEFTKGGIIRQQLKLAPLMHEKAFRLQLNWVIQYFACAFRSLFDMTN